MVDVRSNFLVVLLASCLLTYFASQAAEAQTFASLSGEQKANAETIISVGQQFKIPKRGWIVAVAAAMGQSQLQNLDTGTKDARGLFQQRPSQGWGTAADVLDPVASTKAFYGVSSQTLNSGLWQIRGWESMTIGQAAQAVLVAPSSAPYDKYVTLATQAVG